MLKGNKKDKPNPMPIISVAHEDKAREHKPVAVIKHSGVEKTTCINNKSGICKGITISNNIVSCFGHKSKCEHPGLYKEL